MRPDTLDRAVRERVRNGYSRGLVAGLLQRDGRTRFIAHGDSGLGRPLAAGHVFEIGSVTKVFTGTLLAQMAQRGEVALDDPIQKLIPTGVRVPSREGRQITLEDLATHTSGLPCLPSNLAPADDADPYADYTVEQLYEFLSSYTLTRDIGAEHEYSNVGVGLLGHVLALRAGRSYGHLLRQRILVPLGMTSTAIEETAAMRRRFVAGHDDRGRAVAHWNLGVLAGAGGLRSTAADMLRFAAAGLDAGSDLGGAIRTAQSPRFEIEPELRIGLSWMTDLREDHDIVWHNGGTAGFASFLGIERARGIAVVVLSNSIGDFDDLGMHALDERMPLARMHQPVALPAAALQRFVGDYDGPDGAVALTVADGGLAAQAPGEPPLHLTPIGEMTFLIRAAGALVNFERDAGGRVTGAVLSSDGGGPEIRFERTAPSSREGGGR